MTILTTVEILGKRPVTNIEFVVKNIEVELISNYFENSTGGGGVQSVNSKTGPNVSLTAADIPETSTLKWLTSTLKSAYDGAVSAIANIYTKTETDTLLSNKVDKVSGKGLSQNDLTNDLKASYDGAVSGLSNKVDKVTGKGLSENDFTNALKSTYDGYASQISAKANVSEVAIVLFKSITPTIITGKTAETSIYSIPLPADGHNYMIRVYSQAQITTMAGLSITHRLRVGSYLAPIDGSSGADAIANQTQIAQYASASAVGISMVRNLIFNGGSSGSIVSIAPASTIFTDESSAFMFSTAASNDFTTQHYLYVTFNPNNAAASILHNQVLVTATRI